MIRSILERVVRGTVIRRRLPREFGRRPIYLSADSALSYLQPRWAQAHRPLLDAAAQHAENAKAVWDIGANCGVFTFAAAHAASPDAEILAVEPDPFLATLLQRSARAPGNSDRNVAVLCTAVGDEHGVARFMIAQRGRSSNALERTGHRSQAGGARFVQHVPIITLDALLRNFRAPDVIKVDVEGAEALVLQGAAEMLRTIRPVIYIEVGDQQNAAVTRIFLDNDYRLFDGDGDNHARRDSCAFNTLAIPAERRR